MFCLFREPSRARWAALGAGRDGQDAQVGQAVPLHVLLGAVGLKIGVEASLEAFDGHGGAVGLDEEVRAPVGLGEVQAEHGVGVG